MTDTAPVVGERVTLEQLGAMYEMAGACAVKGKLLRELIDEIRDTRKALALAGPSLEAGADRVGKHVYFLRDLADNIEKKLCHVSPEIAPDINSYVAAQRREADIHAEHAATLRSLTKLGAP